MAPMTAMNSASPRKLPHWTLRSPVIAVTPAFRMIGVIAVPDRPVGPDRRQRPVGGVGGGGGRRGPPQGGGGPGPAPLPAWPARVPTGTAAPTPRAGGRRYSRSGGAPPSPGRAGRGPPAG